ncbi:MAG: hypothetical protein ACI9WS_002754, partial [Paraglaciecola psychrophila]
AVVVKTTYEKGLLLHNIGQFEKLFQGKN